MAVWDGLIPDSDLQNFAKARMGEMQGPGAHPALIVVDLSYGFVDSRFPRGHSEAGAPVVAATRELLAVTRRLGVPTFFTTMYDDQDYPGLFWKGTRGYLPDENQIHTDLSPQPGEMIICKRKASAFFCTDLIHLLIHRKVDSLIVTGMTTSGCVRATVVDAFQYNFKVTVPLECVGDRGQVSHKVSLFDMHMKYADVVSLADCIGALNQLPTREAGQDAGHP